MKFINFSFFLLWWVDIFQCFTSKKFLTGTTLRWNYFLKFFNWFIWKFYWSGQNNTYFSRNLSDRDSGNYISSQLALNFFQKTDPVPSILIYTISATYEFHCIHHFCSKNLNYTYLLEHSNIFCPVLIPLSLSIILMQYVVWTVKIENWLLVKHLGLAAKVRLIWSYKWSKVCQVLRGFWNTRMRGYYLWITTSLVDYYELLKIVCFWPCSFAITPFRTSSYH